VVQQNESIKRLNRKGGKLVPLLSERNKTLGKTYSKFPVSVEASFKMSLGDIQQLGVFYGMAFGSEADPLETRRARVQAWLTGNDSYFEL